MAEGNRLHYFDLQILIAYVLNNDTTIDFIISDDTLYYNAQDIIIFIVTNICWI